MNYESFNVMSTMKKILSAITVVSGLMAMPGLSHALLVANPNMPIEDLVGQSDEIIIGKVVGKNVTLERGAVLSNYQISVGENLKLSDKAFAAGKTFDITLAGGELTSSPIATHVPGVPHMYNGEEVLLFLRTHPISPETKTRNATVKLKNPAVVGWEQGHFTIVSDGENVRQAIRIGSQFKSAVNNGFITKQIVGDIKAKKIRLKSQQLLRSKNLAGPSQQKDALELTSTDTQNVITEKKLQNAESVRNSMTVGGVPAQDLDSLKTEIRSFVK